MLTSLFLLHLHCSESPQSFLGLGEVRGADQSSPKVPVLLGRASLRLNHSSHEANTDAITRLVCSPVSLGAGPRFLGDLNFYSRKKCVSKPSEHSGLKRLRQPSLWSSEVALYQQPSLRGTSMAVPRRWALPAEASAAQWCAARLPRHLGHPWCSVGTLPLQMAERLTAWLLTTVILGKPF